MKRFKRRGLGCLTPVGRKSNYRIKTTNLLIRFLNSNQ